jgi:hypothetical protein
MVDTSLVRLLRECDNYLVRQRALLDHAAFIDCDGGLRTAMDAALDQLTGAVVDGWSISRDEATDASEDRGDPGLRTDLGE